MRCSLQCVVAIFSSVALALALLGLTPPTVALSSAPDFKTQAHSDSSPLLVESAPVSETTAALVQLRGRSATVIALSPDLDPSDIVIAAGSTVVWVNQGSEALRISSHVQNNHLFLPVIGSSGGQVEGQSGELARPAQASSPTTTWASVLIAPGEKFERAFDAPGAYPYFINDAIDRGATVTVVALAGGATEEVYIASGQFTMGCSTEDGAWCVFNEQPQHAVELSGYYIDKYEVTNAGYQQCVAAGVCTAPAGASSTRTFYYGNPDYAAFPVTNVTWYQAHAFCAWAGKRLPTEAEWEKAARGSSDARIYPWGDAAPDCSIANIRMARWTGFCVGDTTAVGSYVLGASPYGVMDMAGNVWEWVGDWYSQSYYAYSPALNPSGPLSGNLRVLRGGAWGGNGLDARLVLRNFDLPDYANEQFGIRCARSE